MFQKKVCFAFGWKGHLSSRHLCISATDFAAKRFLLICIYLGKSVSQKLLNTRNILKL